MTWAKMHSNSRSEFLSLLLRPDNLLVCWMLELETSARTRVKGIFGKHGLEVGKFSGTQSATVPPPVEEGDSPTVQRWKTQNRSRTLCGPLYFINHACKNHANCYPVDDWNGIEALVDIGEKDELTICYGDNYFTDGKNKCKKCLKTNN